MTSPSERNARSFLDAVAHGHLVGDGAMGSELHARGVPFRECFEALNVSRPELVAAIHRAHVDAGAAVVETNTFGANPTRLAQHGLGAQLRALNLAGARVAREAGGNVWVVGAIGPTGLVFPRDPRDLSQAARAVLRDGFRMQAEALAEGGVDALVIETMRDPRELRLAIEGALGHALPIVALATFDDTLRGPEMADGTDPATLVRELADSGAGVLGANCGTGPRQLLEVARRMLGARPGASALPFAMFPSAGLPAIAADGSAQPPVSPEDLAYAARELFALGVRWVGGCCGTDRAHVAAIAGAAR